MIIRIINRLRKCIYRKKFKSFANTSRIEKPLRLLGEKYIEIGECSSIMKGIRLEAIDTYGEQKFSPYLRMGNRVGLGQNCHLIATGNLLIGNDVTISGNVFISTCNHQYTDIDINVSKQKLDSEDVKVGDYSFIGYGAVILGGVTLGKQCVVGANSVVLKGSYPDYSVLAGVPARIVKQYNIEEHEWKNIK